jgi:hypothetical protein
MLQAFECIILKADDRTVFIGYEIGKTVWRSDQKDYQVNPNRNAKQLPYTL